MEHYTIVIIMGLNCGSSDPDCDYTIKSAIQSNSHNFTSSLYEESKLKKDKNDEIYCNGISPDRD